MPMGTGAVGLAGDRVYDVKHYGGVDQAVYAYAREDLEERAEQYLAQCRKGNLLRDTLPTVQGTRVTRKR